MRFSADLEELEKLSKEDLEKHLGILSYLLICILLESRDNKINTRIPDATFRDYVIDSDYQVDFNTDKIFPDCITTLQLVKKVGEEFIEVHEDRLPIPVSKPIIKDRRAVLAKTEIVRNESIIETLA